MKIQLGSKVKDKITGFVGIAVARTEFLNGCVQYLVQPKIKKNNEIPEDKGIDEQSLEVIKSKIKKKKKRENGGAMTEGFSQRGY